MADLEHVKYKQFYDMRNKIREETHTSSDDTLVQFLGGI